MKKSTKILFISLLVVTLIATLCITSFATDCEHIHINDDCICDICGSEYHWGDEDYTCDVCGMTIDHTCSGSGGICKYCGCPYECDCIDEDDDWCCDYCGEFFDDGCDFHYDTDDDLYCDSCGDDLDDGNEITYGQYMELYEEYCSLLDTIDILNESNQQLQNTNTSLQEQNNTLTNSNLQLQNDNLTLQGQNNTLTNEKTILQEQNNTLSNSNLQLQNDNLTLQEQNNNLVNSNNLLQADYLTLKTEIDEYIRQRDEAREGLKNSNAILDFFNGVYEAVNGVLQTFLNLEVFGFNVGNVVAIFLIALIAVFVIKIFI